MLRGQGATEYLLMLAAASVIIVVVLAMVNGMKDAIPTHVVVNGTNQTMVEALRNQFAKLVVVP